MYLSTENSVNCSLKTRSLQDHCVILYLTQIKDVGKELNIPQQWNHHSGLLEIGIPEMEIITTITEMGCRVRHHVWQHHT